MQENFAEQLLGDFRGYVKQIKHFDRVIENYAASTISPRVGSIDTIASKLRALADKQAVFIRRTKFVRTILSKMNKTDRSVLVGFYIRRMRPEVIAERLNCCPSTIYRRKKVALKRFVDISAFHEDEFDL